MALTATASVSVLSWPAEFGHPQGGSTLEGEPTGAYTSDTPAIVMPSSALDPPANALHLRTFGAVELAGRDEARDLLAQPRRLALFLYLAIARPRGYHRRDTLVGMFWPEQPDAQARAALRKSLYAIRRAVGEDCVLSRGDDDLCVPAERVWTDAEAFDAAIGEGMYAAALELYRGDLLTGFFADAPGFETWASAERERYRDGAAVAAWALAERYEQGANLTMAARWARKAARLAGADERRVRKAIQMLDRAGDRAGAAKVYDDFVAYLRRELEVEPAPETVELGRRVLGR